MCDGEEGEGQGSALAFPFFPVVDVQAAAATARRATTVIRWAR